MRDQIQHIKHYLKLESELRLIGVHKKSKSKILMTSKKSNIKLLMEKTIKNQNFYLYEKVYNKIVMMLKILKDDTY